MAKVNVYEIIRDRFIQGLKKGEIPWRRPWKPGKSGGLAVNWLNEKPYSGINQLMLDGGEYATFKQVTEAGGKVKKGEHGNIICFFSFIDLEEKRKKERLDGKAVRKRPGEENEPDKIPFLKYSYVFEISEQCEGLSSKRTKERKPLVQRIEAAEKIKREYRDCPPIFSHPSKAFYSLSGDIISIPKIEKFENVEGYYSTLFHEMAHSTEHPRRLNRIVEKRDKREKKRERYSKEELIAEMTAAILCKIADIERPEVIENSIAYVNNWLKYISESSPQMIVRAASAAQKAADYILNIPQIKEA